MIISNIILFLIVLMETARDRERESDEVEGDLLQAGTNFD